MNECLAIVYYCVHSLIIASPQSQFSRSLILHTLDNKMRHKQAHINTPDSSANILNYYYANAQR